MRWLLDTTERAARTFVQAWLAAWLAVGDRTLAQLWNEEVITIGVGAAALSVLTSLAARTRGDPDSASLRG